MPEGLPYFKFYVAEWSNGKIAVEDFQVQGIFINICAYYWTRNGNVKFSELEKKFPKIKRKYCRVLFENEIIKIENETKIFENGAKKNENETKKNKNEKITISFLDEQLTEREKISKQNSANGKLGGRKREASALNSLNENEANGKRTESERKAIRERREEKRREEKRREEKREEEEKKREKKEKEKKEIANAPFTGELLKLWEDWEKHRRQKHNPLTAVARERQIKFLSARTSSAAVEILTFSLENGYTGLFPPEKRSLKNGKTANKKLEGDKASREYLANHYSGKPSE